MRNNKAACKRGKVKASEVFSLRAMRCRFRRLVFYYAGIRQVTA